jgi:hypothetical protein
MKNTGLAFGLFALGYVIATVVGFVTYSIHPTVMWVTIFTLMPVVFGALFYTYLRRTGCDKTESLRESHRLILLWIVLSFLVDALVYVVVVPLVSASPSNWTFFIDQSPWIWLNYLTVVILGYLSRWFYLRSLNEARRG